LRSILDSMSMKDAPTPEAAGMLLIASRSINDTSQGSPTVIC
jgi:hypothetical protein